jgi:septum site-determining protein MinD
MGETLGIISLKGGVGKTSSVASLGAAMADFDKRVLLVDGNLSAPNLGLHLNVINPEISLHDVLNRKININDSICEVNRENFHFIPSSILFKIKVNPFQLRNKIKSLKRKYDYILLDSSPSLDDETLAVMLASDSLLVVTTPDYPTLSTTIKAIQTAKERGTPIIGLILNKVHNKNFEISIHEIERLAETPVMAVIPYNKNILRALSEFTPLPYYKPNSDGSIEYKKLAAALIGEKYKPFRLKRFLKLGPKREDINREIYYKSFFRD